MSDVVLDASAVLALLQDEPGSDIVARSLPGAALSAVNLSEVVAKLTELGLSEADVHAALQGLGLVIHSFEDEMAYATGLLRSRPKSLRLSLGDRAALALGRRLSALVLTTDRAWRGLHLGVKVKVIR